MLQVKGRCHLHRATAKEKLLGMRNWTETCRHQSPQLVQKGAGNEITPQVGRKRVPGQAIHPICGTSPSLTKVHCALKLKGRHHLRQEWEHSAETEEEHASKSEIPENSEEKFRKLSTFSGVYKKVQLLNQRSRKSQEGTVSRTRPNGRWIKMEGAQEDWKCNSRSKATLQQQRAALKLQDTPSVTKNKCERNSNNTAEGERFRK